MIYTVTLNPSLDYTANAEKMEKGKTNRTNGEYIVAGGKGLNVSIMLSRLGMSTTALGFSAGFTGEKLESILMELGCKCDFVKLKTGFTRINVKLVSDEVTEFNGSGVELDEENINLLEEKISRLTAEDTLVLSGSIPKGADSGIYSRLLCALPKGATAVVDACGEPLAAALKNEPFLIKPNVDELSELFKKPISSTEDIIAGSAQLKKMGAKNVLVSRGEDGAVLLAQNGKIYESAVPHGKMLNTVGAGDSMVAGFLYGFSKNGKFEQAINYAVAAGSATAYSRWLATGETVKELYDELCSIN